MNRITNSQTYFLGNKLQRQWHLTKQLVIGDLVPKDSILPRKNCMKHDLSGHTSYDFHTHHGHSLDCYDLFEMVTIAI